MLAIPRGGVVTGAVLACELGAELDVVLSRKLRAPGQPELAIGAISETGDVYLIEYGKEWGDELKDYLMEKRRLMAQQRRFAVDGELPLGTDAEPRLGEQFDRVAQFLAEADVDLLDVLDAAPVHRAQRHGHAPVNEL